MHSESPGCLFWFYVNSKCGYHFSIEQSLFIQFVSGETCFCPRRTIRFPPSRLYINKTSKEQTANFFPHTSAEEARCSELRECIISTRLEELLHIIRTSRSKSTVEIVTQTSAATHAGGAAPRRGFAPKGSRPLAGWGRLTFL